MPNAIVTSYLADASIPVEKRRSISEGLNSGGLSESAAVQGITMKYGTKYGDPAQQGKDLAGNITKGIMGGLAPQNLVKNAAMGIKAGADLAKQAGIKVDVTAPAGSDERNAAVQKLNAKGVIPNSGRSSSEMEALANEPKDYGVLQPLRDVTANFRENLDSLDKDKFVKENNLGAVEAVAENPLVKEVTRAGASAAMGATEGFIQQGGNIVEQLNPFKRGFDDTKRMLDELKAAHPETAAQVDAMKESMSPQAWANKLAQGTSEIADKGITESTGIKKDSISGNIGGATGKFASWLPGLAAGSEIATSLGGKGALLGDVAKATVEANTITGSEGRAASVPDIALTYGVNKAFEFAGDSLSKLFKSKKLPATQKEAVVKKVMDELGIKEQDAYLLSDLTPDQQQVAKQALKDGLAKLENKAAPGAYSKAAGEVDDFMTAAKDYQKALGAEVGAGKEALKGVQAPTLGMQSTVDDIAKKYNISVADDFWGDIEGSAQAKKLFIQAQKMANSPTVDARALESLTSQIDKQLGVYSGRGIQAGNPAIKVLTDLKSAANQTIEKVAPEFGALNNQYAQVTQAIKQVESAASDKVAGKAVLNPEVLLRRLTGDAAGKSKAAVQALDDLADFIGTPAPKDLATKANIAAWAEDITKSNNPMALQGSVEAAGTNLRSAVSKDLIKSVPGGNILNTLREAFQKRGPVIEANANKIINWLGKGALEAGEGFTPNLPKAGVNKVILGIETLIKSGLIDELNEKEKRSKPL